jgi:HD-GYP domain-containing protein (c-di-GMP phosphodiesterase class II)
MWTKPGPGIPIDASQVVEGLFVFLDIRWQDHPFMFNRFLVTTPKEVAIIQALDTQGHLYYYPEKSTVPLPAFVPPPPTSAEMQAALAAEKAAVEAERSALDKAKKDKRQRQKDAAARADRAWENAARHTKDALLTLSRSPKAAGELLANLSQETATAIAQGQEVLLHLLGDKKDQGPQFHALNVLTLCMLVGKKMGLSLTELADLAMGALAHDAGKVQVPAPILKNAKRKKHEEDFFRQHVAYSVQLCADSGAFSREALNIIGDHHEAVDGSGWPRATTELSRCTRILSVVNRYDNLCTPEADGVDALMPSEALANMFRNEGAQFDKLVLTTLIKLLGVYPPGTVVQLSDTSLAMVVGPGPTSLQPQVLIYSPELPKDEAPTLELHTEPSLKITEAIKPASLPPDVRAWLNPQQRLSYFFSVEDNKG